MIKNSATRFGSVSISLHWLIALLIFGEFGLGLYMTDLDYHHPLYQDLPELHESFGILILALVVGRLGWALINPKPRPEAGVGPLVIKVSTLVKHLMTAVTVGIVVFGYLLSTAGGEEILIFDAFLVPPLFDPLKGQEDIAAFWHEWLAWTIIALACLHTAGAFKHHFFDQDETLRRMLGLKPRV